MFNNRNKTRMVTSVRFFDSIVAKGMALVGSLFAHGSVKISGSVIGPISKAECTDGHVPSVQCIITIDTSGVVSGNIVADAVIIAGVVTGNITADTVHIAATAKIRGNIACELLSIEPGSEIAGHVTQTKNAPVDGELSQRLASEVVKIA